MALTSSSAKIAQGTAPTLTATITSTKPVTGTVTFAVVTPSLGSIFNSGPITLVNGVAQTQVTGLPLGTVEIDASYSGDASNLASMSSFNQTSTGSTQVIVDGATGQNFHELTINATLQ